MASAALYRAAALALLCLGSGPALACWPSEPSPYSPAAGRFPYPASSAIAPIHLPANAAGVVLLLRAPVKPKEFSVRELASHRLLPVAITPIAGLKMPPPVDLAGPIRGTDVKALRVGPRAGFQPGKAYQIQWDSMTVNVAIDTKAVHLDAHPITLTAEGAPNAEPTLNSYLWCGTRTVISGTGHRVHMGVDYHIASELAPYRDRILANDERVERRPGDPNDHRSTISYYLDAMDGGYSAFIVVHRESLNLASDDEPATIIPRHWHAQYLFPEIDDQWRASVPLQVGHVHDRIEHKDSLDFLRDAMRSKDPLRLQAQLDETPVRDTDLSPAIQRKFDRARKETPANLLTRAIDTLQDWRYQRRQRSLVHALSILLQHRAAPIRANAALAIGRVLTHGELDPVTAHSTVYALRQASADRDRQVRLNAQSASATVSKFLAENGLACTGKVTHYTGCIAVPVNPANPD